MPYQSSVGLTTAGCGEIDILLIDYDAADIFPINGAAVEVSRPFDLHWFCA